MTFTLHSSAARLAILVLCILAAVSSACNRSSTQATNSSTKHYSFKGKIDSIDKQAALANIENEAIAGFMEPMVMPYTIKPAAMLDQLQPGDSITGDLYVQPDNSYWLENVKAVGHSKLSAERPAAQMHVPAPGDAVPDFKLVNQNGKQISLGEYRGETLVLTMIYTRCPFPDFCPRVSREFAAIDSEMLANPARFGKTHLLSISFDPAYDTPKVLREYGFSLVGKKNPALFTHWEFSAVPAAELPEVANYFALTYKEEGGLITHSLSTAVISPDGRIFKWYHGADWKAADLLQDIAAAHSAT